MSLTPSPDASGLLRIPARKLLNYSVDYLWDNLEGDFVLVFDDGESIVTNEKETIYSALVWDYHRSWPETPLLKRHHIADLLKGKRLKAKSNLELINIVLWDTYDTYKAQVPDKVALIDQLSKRSYEVSTSMYNEFSSRLSAYMTTLDILDFTSITTHPRVKEAYRLMEPTEEGVNRVNAEISALIDDPNELIGNSLTKTLHSELARKSQALQCLGPLGFRTDIDSHLFTAAPIKRGFVQGLRSLYDAMVESRTASMSLIYSTEPLQQSEYFSRRQQLICQNVRNLHQGDCGSQHYLHWPVRDVQYFGKTKIADCDLNTIAGKYYLDEPTNTLKIVHIDDRHLIGRTLKLRSVVAGCTHPDPYGICEVCFGQMSEAVPANSNIGHITCVTMTSDLGQNILSTKHFIGSSVIEGIVLGTQEKKYLTAPLNGNEYYLNKALSTKTVKLIMPASHALGLADLHSVDNAEDLSITRVSEFGTIWISVGDARSEEVVSLKVEVQGRLSNMTHALLRHIKEKGWTVTKNKVTKDDNYTIDMTGWDYELPVFQLPMRHFNMSDHQTEIASILESTVGQLEERSTMTPPCSLLIEFHDLVNRRLSVNLAVLEVILYSSMIVSAADNDYSLPKPGGPAGFGVMRKIFSARSLSAVMGFQNHSNTFISAASYVNKNRMDHVMDAMVMPAEVLGLMRP